ncbi:MAG: pilin [Patescibacteria group bacterium]
MKRFSLALVSLLVFLFPFSASAQGILPSTTKTDSACQDLFVSNSPASLRDQIKSNSISLNDVLACALRTGRVKLWMAPFFILSAIEFLSGLAGLLSVGYIVVGGYHYVIGGISEEKDKGTKTIKNALIGFILSMLAYTIVNIIQLTVSS